MDVFTNRQPQCHSISTEHMILAWLTYLMLLNAVDVMKAGGKQRDCRILVVCRQLFCQCMPMHTQYSPQCMFVHFPSTSFTIITTFSHPFLRSVACTILVPNLFFLPFNCYSLSVFPVTTSLICFHHSLLSLTSLIHAL